MSKRRKKTKPERDKGESILDSTSESSEYSDSRTVLEDHEDFYLPYRVADYCRRYPEDASAGHEFIVFIESVTEQPLGSRDMLTLSSCLSRFIKGIKYLKKLNKYKIGVVFERPNLANTFLDNTTFLREQNIKASIPAGATELSGVISSVPIDMSNKKIFKSLSSTKKIISVRRIMKKNKSDSGFILQPTQAVIITFASSTSLPDYVHLKMWRLPVRPYVPPVKQCFRCLRFDHLAKFCKNAQRCSICTENHSYKECTIPIDKAVCVHCKDNHLAVSGQCPIKQKKILDSKNKSKTPLSDLFKHPTNFPSLNKTENTQDIINLILSNPAAMNLITESIIKVITLNKTQNQSISSHAISSAIKDTIQIKNKTSHSTVTNLT